MKTRQPQTKIKEGPPGYAWPREVQAKCSALGIRLLLAGLEQRALGARQSRGWLAGEVRQGEPFGPARVQR